MIHDHAPTQNTTHPLSPVSLTERIPALDIVRGVALFGVLMAYALWNLGNPPETEYSNVDRWLDLMLTALIDTKSYTIFAFLFGLGFSIQLMRAEARGLSIVPVYRRRLLALLGIGLAHALLLRNGDILVPYALMGFCLLLFRHASNRALLVGAIAGLVYPYLARRAWELTGIPFPARPSEEGLGYFADNFAWVRYWYATAISFWPGSLPMFLCGLYVGRRRLFEIISDRRKGLWQILLAGLCIGVLAFAAGQLLLPRIANVPSILGQRMVLGLLWSIHAWGLAAFYISTLLLLLRHKRIALWLSPFGAVGRMALTNYLLQAVIIVPICIGFGLFGRITPHLGMLLALAVWSVQAPASVWWLNRFRFGPAEWIWRSLTYGQLQTMRITTRQSGETQNAFSEQNCLPR